MERNRRRCQNSTGGATAHRQQPIAKRQPPPSPRRNDDALYNSGNVADPLPSTDECLALSRPSPLTTQQHPNRPCTWGIDIGGTNIKCGLVDHEGETVAFEQIPTQHADGPQAAVERIAEVIERTEQECQDMDRPHAIGLGAPGPMDLPRGLLVAPPQLPSWWDFPIVEQLSRVTSRDVVFLNDANAAAYGEFWLGSGAQQSSMILLTLGTGVGGGIIIENELVNGVNSFGSECGHILVDSAPDARLCDWGGGRGQLEAYASATAVVSITKKRLPEVPESSLYQYLDETNADGDLTSLRIYQAAVQGDALALSIIDGTARWLGIAITTLVHTIDPGHVVLGGAMDFGGINCPIGQRFIERIREEFRQRTFPNVFEGTQISFATLGGNAGYLGAAGYARKNC